MLSFWLTTLKLISGRNAVCTYDDEEDEVDEVVKGVSVHDVVHDVHPAF